MTNEITQAVGAPLERRVRPAAPRPGKRLTTKQKRMQRAIRFLADYMATYEQQVGCLNYSDKILIDDVLYGLGVAFEPQKHEYARGFDVWKDKLREHLADE